MPIVQEETIELAPKSNSAPVEGDLAQDAPAPQLQTGFQQGPLNERVKDEQDFLKFDDMSFVQVSLILMSLGLAMFIFAIEETIVATSVAAIGAALNVKGSLTWISTSYLLTTTVIQPITGRVADAIGTKRLMLIELWIFILGNIIAGTSKTLTQIIVGRLISGIGGAGLLSLACILVSQLTHERQRASYMNLVNAVFIITDALGPILGGALAKSGNWRWIFLLNVPFGPVITITLMRYLRIPHKSTHIRTFRDVVTKFDFIGMFMLVASLSFLVVALNSGGQTASWGSSMVIGLLCALGVTWVAFWVVEGYAKMPIAPVRLFGNWEWRNVPLMMITRTLLFFHNFAMIFYVPIFLQVIGLPTLSASALIIPFLTTAAISSTAANALTTKYGHTRLILTGGLAVLPIGMGLMSTLNETSSIARIVGYSLVSGFGFGSGTQITMVVAQVGVPADELSTVTALIGSTPSLGGTLGVAVVGTVINNAFRHTLSRSSIVMSKSTNSSISLNPNDVVNTLSTFSKDDPVRALVVKAYVLAWKKGCYALAGVAAMQVLLCLFMRKVEFDDGKKGLEAVIDVHTEGVGGEQKDTT